MHHTKRPVPAQQLQGVAVRVAVMNQNRQTLSFCQQKLALKKIALYFFRRHIVVVVIQPDLPQRHHLRFLQQQSKLLLPVLRQAAGLLRMDPHSGVQAQATVPAGKPERFSRRGNIRADGHRTADTSAR